jgi:hypothetical protein
MYTMKGNEALLVVRMLLYAANCVPARANSTLAVNNLLLSLLES